MRVENRTHLMDKDLPPAPSRPRVVKKSFDSVTFQLNWTPPAEYCRKDQIEASILTWDYAEVKETLTFEDKERENIGIHLYSMDSQPRIKKIVNKRAKNIAVSGLIPGQRYCFWVRFLYSVNANDDFTGPTEGKKSHPVEVKLPMRLLSCNGCGTLLLWGLEICPRCKGEASNMAWAKKSRR